MDSMISWPSIALGSLVAMLLFFWAEKRFILPKIKQEFKKEEPVETLTLYNIYHGKVISPEKLADQKSMRASQYLARHTFLVNQQQLKPDEMEELKGLVSWLQRNTRN